MAYRHTFILRNMNQVADLAQQLPHDGLIRLRVADRADSRFGGVAVLIEHYHMTEHVLHQVFHRVKDGRGAICTGRSEEYAIIPEDGDVPASLAFSRLKKVVADIKRAEKVSDPNRDIFRLQRIAAKELEEALRDLQAELSIPRPA